MHPGMTTVISVAYILLFACGVAPTLLWGDDAELQRIAVTGEARVVGQSSIASHLLWQFVASTFVRWTTWLPVDQAGRVTLVSAIFAALALVSVFLLCSVIANRIGLHTRGAVVASAVGAMSLGLSHTFWLLASRPDAYTIQTFLLASALWAAVRASESASPWRWWLVVGIVAVTLTNHAMVLASLPGLGVVAISGQTIVVLHALRYALELLGRARSTRFAPDFAGYVRLIALASTAGLPRFLFFDAMGGVPFSLWYGVVLVAADGVAVHYFDAGATARWWIWRAGAVTLVPWVAYWWVPTWPDPAWALP
jgi:hypothetical protein